MPSIASGLAWLGMLSRTQASVTVARKPVVDASGAEGLVSMITDWSAAAFHLSKRTDVPHLTASHRSEFWNVTVGASDGEEPVRVDWGLVALSVASCFQSCRPSIWV